MKPLLILLCGAMCAASCTSYTNGSEKLTQFGGKFYRSSDGSFGADNAESLLGVSKDIRSLGNTAIVTGGIVDGLGIAAGALTKVTGLKEATTQTGIKAAQSTEQAKISAATQEAALKAESQTPIQP